MGKFTAQHSSSNNSHFFISYGRLIVFFHKYVEYKIINQQRLTCPIYYVKSSGFGHLSDAMSHLF